MTDNLDKNLNMESLEDSELDQAAGGKRIHAVGSTNFVCDACRYRKGKRGNHVGEVIKCPKCQNITFRGLDYFPRD